MAALRSPAARRPTGKDGWRSPAMVLPYLGLIGGTILLARIPEERLERFWWLAPVTIFAFLVLFAATVAALARRRSCAGQGTSELEAMRGELMKALEASPRARRSRVEKLTPRLPEVRRASRQLSADEQIALRATLKELNVHRPVEERYFAVPTRNDRAETLQMLGWLADDRSILLLRGVLNGQEPELGYVAGQALAEFDSKRAFECLAEALRGGSLSRPLVETLIEGSRFSGRRAPA